MAFRSASEYTAAVAMPSSRHARMTRMAISPLFATKIFLKSLLLILSIGRASFSSDREQRLARTDDLALPYVDLADGAGHGRDDVVLHLHRLEHRDYVAELHSVTDLDRDLDDEPLHRRNHGALADLRRGRRRCRRGWSSTGGRSAR